MKLPDAALQQHIAILGKTGSGKSTAAKAVIIEPVLAAGRRVCIVDPTSAHWGLRTSHDGKGPGFPILILGGDHGDLPLPALGGAAVARLVVEQNVNLVADTSSLTVGERTRWFIDFATTLHRLNRTPLHLIIDEMHLFAPQGKIPDPEAGKMLHAANTLASAGRSRGIRLTMITQRPAKLHKDALTCADTLIAMRVLAPQDRTAVEDWIKGCGDLKAGTVVLNSLASLQRGEGWIWYPEGDLLERVKFPPIKTFDSSATPIDGTTAPAPKGAAELDLTEIKAAMAEAVKEAEANDPKLLRARIHHLEGLLKNDAVERRIKDALEDARQEWNSTALQQDSVVHARSAEAYLKDFDVAMTGLTAFREVLARNAIHPAPVPAKSQSHAAIAPAHALTHTESTSAPPARPTTNADGKPLAPAERKFLIALAQQDRPLTRNQVAIFAGYSPKSGHVDNTLGALRTAGRIVGGREAIRITGMGRDDLGQYDPLPTGRDLLEFWKTQLDPASAAFLGVLAAVYPSALTRNQVAEKAGYSVQSGHVDNTLGALRTRDLIVGGRNAIRLSENLA